MFLRLARFAAPAIFAIAAASALSAQETTLPDMTTDRPSTGTTPDIVPAASLQIENGAAILFNAKAYTANLPESLLRLGVGHRSELRFTVSNAFFDPNHAPGDKALQLQDTAAGMKLNLAEANKGPLQSILFNFGFPTGADSQTSGSYDPSIILIAQQSLPNHWSLIENAGAVLTTIDGKRHTNWLPGLVIAKQTNKSLGWFAEYAPTASIGASPVHILDAGLTYLRTATSQLDFKVGVQKDQLGQRNILSLGYSHRLDNLARGLFHQPQTKQSE